MIALQLLFTYMPLMNTAFDSAPLEAWMWLPILGTGLATFVAVEVEKWVRRRIAARRSDRLNVRAP
jgi:hypothetical protein